MTNRSMMGPVIRQVQRPVQPEIEGSHEPPRWRTWAARAAGPILIVAAVLVVLHAVAFSGLLLLPAPDARSIPDRVRQLWRRVGPLTDRCAPPRRTPLTTRAPIRG